MASSPFTASLHFCHFGKNLLYIELTSVIALGLPPCIYYTLNWNKCHWIMNKTFFISYFYRTFDFFKRSCFQNCITFFCTEKKLYQLLTNNGTQTLLPISKWTCLFFWFSPYPFFVCSICLFKSSICERYALILFLAVSLNKSVWQSGQFCEYICNGI